MRLLVTGGAGFIGSNFLRLFLRRRPEDFAVTLDKLTYAGNLDNIRELLDQPGFEFVRGDICERKDLTEVFDRGIDAVVHFAAESHVDRSIDDAQEFIRTNVQGTYLLLNEARRRKVPRFLHVSTDEVYGSLSPGESADENHQLEPNSPYAASKASSDLIVRSFWQTFHYPVLVTRCTNNYGPNQFPEKLIPLMITNALEGKKLPVYGDGLNERDWIYVEDHCAAVLSVLEKGREGEIYNIGYGRPVTNLEIVRSLLATLAKPESLIEFVADRPGHDRRYALTTEKISRELGWEPAVDLHAGLKKTVAWYIENGDWVRKAKSGEYRTFYEKYYENRRTSLSQL